MEIERRRTLPGPAGRAFALVDDLAAYPDWMDLVHDVSVATPEDDEPAWNVELQAQVGPFARSNGSRWTDANTPRGSCGQRCHRRTSGRVRTASSW
jgi:ribosome-associated toxin RatA of RatAB toxin-antitoxin module